MNSNQNTKHLPRQRRFVVETLLFLLAMLIAGAASASNPEVVSVVPERDEEFAEIDANITINFNQSIYEGLVSKRLKVYDLYGNLVAAFAPNSQHIHISSNSVQLIPYEGLLDYNTFYTVVLESGFVQNASSEYGSSYAWEFMTKPDNDAPFLTSQSPPHESEDIYVGLPGARRNMAILYFNEPVIPGSGTIEVRRVADNSLFASIDVSDPLDLYVSSFTNIYGDEFYSASLFVEEQAEYLTEYKIIVPDGAITDAFGNSFAGIADGNYTFTIEAYEDVAPPFFTNLTPGHNQGNVDLDTDLFISFGEDIKTGSGTIYLKKFDDNSIVSSYLPTDATIDANLVTFDIPTLDPSTTYYFEIPSGAFMDEADNDFAGTSKTTWAFTTGTGADVTPPQLISTYPEDGDIQIWTYEDLNIVFNEPIEKGIGTIYLKDEETDEVVYQVNVADASVSDYVNKQLAIDLPHTVMENNHEYYVEIASGVITDEEGNNFSGFSKGGWTFKTTDTVNPEHVTLDPPNNSTGIQPDATVTITYDEPIFTHSQGRFRIKRKDNNVTSHTVWMSSYTVSGNQVSFDLPGAGVLDPGEDYYIVDDVGSGLKDAAGNFAQRLWESEWNFKTFTSDDQGPQIVSQTPADNATEIAVNAVFELEFDEPIESAESGTISFYRASNDLLYRTVSMNSDEVSIDGNTLTIDPYWNLNTLTEYYIQMPSVVKDGVGNFFDGINDDSWSFTTVDPGDIIAPQYIGLDPIDDSKNVPVDANLTIYFSEPITVAEGASVMIRPVAGGFMDIPYENITVDGNSITLDPPTNLSPNTEYYVQIGSQVSDLSGNYFVGFGHMDYRWSFTTAPDETPPVLESLSPADDATGVAVDAVFTMTFNERIRKGTAIYLISAIDDQFVDLLIGSEYVVSDNTVTLDPDVELESGKEYYIKVSSTAIRDMSYNDFPGLEDGEWSFTTEGIADAIAPVAQTFTPTHSSTDVNTLFLIVEFDETILPGAGVLELYETESDAKVKVVTLDEATISGTTAIFPIGSTIIQDARDYYVNIDAGMITDLYGNNYAGINDEVTWAFTSGDETRPFVIALEPGNEEADYPITAPELTVYFSENIVAGTGDIYLYKQTGELVEQFDAAVSGSLAFDTNELTITPASLEFNTDYYVTICNTCIEDSSGNTFVGYNNADDWTFSTEGEDIAPSLASPSPLFPADDATGTETDIDLTITFDEDVRAVEGGFAQIKFASSGVTRETIALNSDQAVFSGSTLTLTPSLDLLNETEFYVIIEPGAIEDLAGNEFAGIQGTTAWNFTTQAVPDVETPVVTTLAPYNGQEFIAVDTDLVLYFSEDIQKGTGNVVVRLASDDSAIETISIADAVVSNNTLTIDISDLSNLTEYYIDIPSGAIEDLAGNAFAGTDKSSWSFTTIVFTDTTAPVLVSSSPSHEATGLSVNFDITLTFDEPIQAGTGFIQIYDSDDNLVQNFNGNFVTTSFYSEYSVRFDPPNDLSYGTTYYMVIPSGIIKDLNNNSFTLAANEFEFSTNATDIHAPELLSIDPDDDLDARPMSNFNIFLNFNEAVVGQSDAAVNVRRKDNDEIAYTRNGNNFINANGGKTKWIQNVHNSLDYGVSYYLELESGAFSDAAGNDYVGFGEGTYEFTMEPDVVAPSVVSTAPTLDDDDANRDNLILFFNEAIAIGTGNILIRDAVSGDIEQIIDIQSADVIIDSETALLVELGGLLPYERTYHVEIPAEAITDLAGNSFHGYYEDDWAFTMIDKSDQTISFNGISDRTYGNPDFNLISTATSNLPVSFEIVSGNAEIQGIKLVMLGTGDITVRAIQEGNDYYNAAPPVEQTFSVNKASNAITFSPISTKTYGDDPFQLSASSTSGDELAFSVVSGPVLLEDDLVIITGGGSATIRAEDAGNDNYEAATPVERTFTINKIDQIITFEAIEDKVENEDPFLLEASSTSGLTIDFSIVSGPAVISDNFLAMTGPGEVTVRASQAGNDNFNAASNVDVTFTITEAPDIEGPILASSTPSNGDTEVGLSSSIVLNFDENIVKTMGSVELRRSSDDELLINLGVNQSGVTFSDNTLTLSGLNLPPNNTFYLITVGEVFEDEAGNGFDGFDKGDFTFTTLTQTDNTAPAVASYQPADGETQVEVIEPEIAIEFDEQVITGSGTVNLYDYNTDNLIQSFSIDGSEEDYEVSENSLYLYSNDLEIEKRYYLTVSAGVVQDWSGNDYAGFSDKDQWDFITTDNTVPSVTGLSPAHEAMDVPVDQFTYTLTFNEDIEREPDTPGIWYANLVKRVGSVNVQFINALSDPSVLTVSGNTATIDLRGFGLDDLLPGTEYAIRVVNIADDLSGNQFVGWSDYNTWTFTTAKADQTITFEELEDKTFGDDPFGLTASSSSGLDVDFSIVEGPATLGGTTLTITGAGTVTVAANQSGDDQYNAATEVTRSFEVVKASQIITLEDIEDKLTTDSDFDVVASVDTGRPLTYEVTGPASIDGTTITLNGTSGTVEVTVEQAGDDNYETASESTSFTVSEPGKLDQTITFETLDSKIFGDNSFILTGSASSGLVVSYSSSDETVATIDGDEVTIIGAGTATITATQDGDETYNPASVVEQELTVEKASQSISFDGLANRTFGDSDFELTATTSSGLEVSYSSSNESVATVTGNLVTIVGAGSTVITASQAGNDNYEAALNNVQTLNIDKADQVISFGSLDPRAYGEGPFNLNATSDSGLDVSFASTDASVVSIDGTEVTIIGAGTASITASQAGNENYNAAGDVVQEIIINKAVQTLSIDPVEDKLTTDDSFGITASTTSGLTLSYAISSGPATISGSTVTLTGETGTVTVTVTQVGDLNYESAEESIYFEVTDPSKLDQTITFESISDKTYGDDAFSISATSSSGLEVTLLVSSGPASLSGNTITITGAGEVTIMATQSGDETYNQAPTVERTFTVAKASQAITFDAISDKVYGDDDFTIQASSDAGLDVTFEIVDGPISLNDDVVSISGTGTATIRAIQSGTDNYEVATSIEQSFEIEKAIQSISFDDITDKVYGDSDFTLNASSNVGLDITYEIVEGPISLTDNVVSINGAGNATIRATQGGNENYLAATSVEVSFSIEKLDQIITVTEIEDVNADNDPIMIIASVDSGLPLTYEVSGPATIDGTILTLDGASGEVVVTISQIGDDNHNEASESISFQVLKLAQSITFESIEDKTYGDAAFDLEASSNSGLKVSFEVMSGPATVNGNELTILGAGTIVVAANQEGDDSYEPAESVQQSFVVNKANQTITISPIADVNVDNGPIEIEASLDSDLSLTYEVTGPASIDGNTLTLDGTSGEIIVTVSQAGDDNYNQVSETVSFMVLKLSQTITFESIDDKTFGDEAFALQASASSGLAVSFEVVSGSVSIDGNALTILGGGTVIITANQEGDESYEPAESVQQTFIVNKAEQTITISPIDTQTSGDIVEIDAQSTSGLSLSYEVDGPATLDGSSITLTGVGTVTLTANQDGNDDYLPASNSITFEVIEGVLGFEDELELSVYPNPATDYIFIESNEELSVNLIDLNGKLQRVSMERNRIDLTSIARGIYMLQVRAKGQTKTIRIIKN